MTSSVPAKRKRRSKYTQVTAGDDVQEAIFSEIETSRGTKMKYTVVANPIVPRRTQSQSSSRTVPEPQLPSENTHLVIEEIEVRRDTQRTSGKVLHYLLFK